MLPQKQFFRIGEVAGLVGVEPHVLRYWEREFRSIRPTKSAKGQRVYSRKDVENLLRVRDLLYRDGFTIAGARKKLARGDNDERTDDTDEVARSTERVKFVAPPTALATTPALAPPTALATTPALAPPIALATTPAVTPPIALATTPALAPPTALATTPAGAAPTALAMAPTAYAPASPTGPASFAPSANAQVPTMPPRTAPAPLAMSGGASAAREKLLALRGEVEAFLVELSSKSPR